MSQLWFFGSIAFSFIAWAIVTARYIWPELRLRQRAEALRPALILHSFRFIGLAFLVPGVVSPDLPSAFAHSAAYGDIIAAMLALLALLLLPSAAGVAAAWTSSLWGTADLCRRFLVRSSLLWDGRASQERLAQAIQSSAQPAKFSLRRP